MASHLLEKICFYITRDAVEEAWDVKAVFFCGELLWKHTLLVIWVGEKSLPPDKVQHISTLSQTAQQIHKE